MENLHPDFISGNERWKAEHALGIVKAYAAGYVANAGLHGGLGKDAIVDLFRNSYRAMEAIEEIVKKGEHTSK